MAPLHIAQLRVPSSLRRKTLLIIGITMLGLVGGLFVLSRIVLMRGFARLEEDFAGADISRASSALANELNTLDQTTSEYATWDLTSEYARGLRPSYIKTEFPSSTFQELKSASWSSSMPTAANSSRVPSTWPTVARCLSLRAWMITSSPAHCS